VTSGPSSSIAEARVAQVELDLQRHSTRLVPRVTSQASASDVRAVLEHAQFDCIDDVAVVERGDLLGLIPLETALTAPDDMPVAQLMDADPPIVTDGDDIEPAIWKAVRHHGSTVAVTDAQGEFVGLIPARRLLRALLHEHDEDIARFGGYLSSTAEARSAAEERVVRRLVHRLPWLFVGLAGALIAAGIVAGFEEQLTSNVAVAFFLPGIVYLADAVGTQTEAVVIRGLSVGVPMRHVVRRESLTGILVGLALALTYLPIGLLLWSDNDVVVATAIALFAASAMATLVAMGLPAFLHHLGRDPAFGSGPVATVIQDLASLLIYFAVVAAIVA
jgi:magnesium transporter